MITNEQYHAAKEWISNSGLGLIHQAPAKYYEAHLNPKRKPRKESKVFDFGSAMHSMTLEENLFHEQFIVPPNFSGEVSQYRKQQFAKANKDKTFVTTDTLEHIQGMREAIYAHPAAAKLLSFGEAEKSYTWVDPLTGMKCKIRPDWWNPNVRAIIDVKSTVDASDKGFARSAFKFRYHVQSPFYFDGMRANGKDPKVFIFIAVEKEPPYLVNVVMYESNEMEMGRSIYQEDLQTYKTCLETDTWPGYGTEIKALELPGFSRSYSGTNPLDS